MRVVPNNLARNGWTAWHLFGSFALVICGVLATSDAWADIFHIATRDEESSQALLVPIAVAWLLWVRRGRFRHCRPTGAWAGPVITLIGWIAYSCGDAYFVQLFWHAGALLVVLGCALTLLGTNVLRNFLPVVFVLAFILPVPGRSRQRIAIPLQKATASATQQLCELSDIPVTRSGNLLNINNVDVAISEACNGLRMMFALILVSFTFAFGSPLKAYARFLVVAASPISAVICNVIRLVPTVWVYGHYSTTTAERFHDASGWLMLVVSFLLLMGIVRLLRWAMLPIAEYTLAYD